MANARKSALITGIGGFIGFHLARRLLKEGYAVVGLDNLNEYYSPSLKIARLTQLGLPAERIQEYGTSIQSGTLRFHYVDLCEESFWNAMFGNYSFDFVIHLAAQAGVRYSLEAPQLYVRSNVDGFVHVLEYVRRSPGSKLIYASSSSVYGKNTKVPFSTTDPVNQPASLYAATKRANELIAFVYHQLYSVKAMGLRFFTVYGPWGRPDMAYYQFADRITADTPIQVFNYGEMYRDFTYIDDVCESVFRLMQLEQPVYWENKLFNIGGNAPVRLGDMIQSLECLLGKVALKELLPLQPGDVERTWADVSDLEAAIHFKPATPLTEGLQQFINWYRDYAPRK